MRTLSPTKMFIFIKNFIIYQITYLKLALASQTGDLYKNYITFHRLSNFDNKISTIKIEHPCFRIRRRVCFPSTPELSVGWTHAGSASVWFRRLVEAPGPRLCADSSVHGHWSRPRAENRHQVCYALRCRWKIQDPAPWGTDGLALVSANCWKAYRDCHKSTKSTYQRWTRNDKLWTICAGIWNFWSFIRRTITNILYCLSRQLLRIERK